MLAPKDYFTRFIKVGASLSAILAYLKFYEVINPALEQVGHTVANPPHYVYWSLGVLLAALIITLYLWKPSPTAKNYYAFVLGLALTSLVYLVVITAILPPARSATRVILIYEGKRPRLTPPTGVLVKRVEIEETTIDKFRQRALTNGLDWDVILVSTVENPSVQLGSFVRSTGEFLEIYSMREVLSSPSTAIVDISASSFVQELRLYFTPMKRSSRRIVILFERDYSEAELNLSNVLRDSVTSNVTSIVFDRNADPGSLKEVQKLTKKDYVVFLGSSAGLRIFMLTRQLRFQNCRLVIPSWLRAEVAPVPIKQLPPVDSTQICVVSKKHELLVTGDYKSWQTLLTTIDDAVHSPQVDLNSSLRKSLEQWAKSENWSNDAITTMVFK